MSITVVTPEHGERTFDADDWATHTGNEDWLDEGALWVASKTDPDQAVAEFARGAWLFVYETVEPVAPEGVWKSGLDEFPFGVLVVDKEGDTWEGEGPGGESYAQWGPFTYAPPTEVQR